MNLRSFHALLVGGVCAMPLVLTIPAAAQDAELSMLADKALAAMQAERWADALALNTQVVTQYGKNNPLQLIGPQFGTIYYRKGICEMKRKSWDEAMKSFEICYRDFPNTGAVAAGGNIFQKMALLKWGEAAMGAENWELAIRQFQKFLKERDKTRDKFPQGDFHIGMAICHYQLGRIPEGNEYLETAIRNKAGFSTPDAGIVAGFQALVNAVILKRNEQALLDFIAKNRGALVIDPYTMQHFSSVFMKLAGDAVGEDMQRAAIALYQFVPATDDAIDEARARLKAVGQLKNVKDGTNFLVRKKLAADLVVLEAERSGKSAPEMFKLAAIAYLHEKNGNVSGAYAAYQQLEWYYPAAAQREENLFNLVRTSSLVDPGPDTQRYAESFLKAFPDSPHVPAVRRLMLASLFYAGEYATCIEVAVPLLDKLAPGTAEHDICLHVLGGSYYYTGQYDRAQPLLDQHVEKYPQSPYVIAATYFQASNVSRLQFWSKAAGLLDEFLKTYPDESDNPFLPFALYDRATCHFAEGQPEPALDRLATVIRKFPETNVLDQAYNLKGNVEQSLRQAEKAENSYIEALKIAEQRLNRAVAEESLFSLVSLLGEKKPGKQENPRFKDAVTYADRFWKEYADGSPYKSRVAVAQVPAFDGVGRGDEALDRLRDVISEMARDPQATGLEELINSYSDAYLEKHTQEELKEHYYNFPGIGTKDRVARALLRVAVIGVFENVAKKSQDEARKRAANAMIKVLFQELKTDFAITDLTNFILVKIGDFLRANTATPREALPYYEAVVDRQDQSYRFAAMLGRADVYSRSAADLAKGIEDFTRVATDSQDKIEREFALYRCVELLMAKRDFAKAAEQAKIYLDRGKTGFSKYSPSVGLLLAKSFEERNLINDAISMYVKVWSAHMGNIKISAPAMKSWMQLSWQRNHPSADPATPGDRQGCYEGGAKYLELTGRFKDKMVASDIEPWQEVDNLVATYAADPAIKSMARIKREKEAAGR